MASAGASGAFKSCSDRHLEVLLVMFVFMFACFQPNSSSHQMPVAKVLGGSVTILGQWPQLDLVIMCLRDQTGLPPNKHKLQPPFHKASVCGPIMLLRMNEQSIPASFNLKEYVKREATQHSLGDMVSQASVVTLADVAVAIGLASVQV